MVQPRLRLGEQMILRMPGHQAYAEQVSKEYCWLPRLAPQLILSVPEPLALGSPAEGYPWSWSIYKWIEGQTAHPDRVSDMSRFALDVATFLAALHRIGTQGGPAPGVA
jgi:aminoglycoside phosphotransferase (APT) family kinase protein